MKETTDSTLDSKLIYCFYKRIPQAKFHISESISVFVHDKNIHPGRPFASQCLLSLIHFHNTGALLTTSRHERIHTRRPYHVDRGDKFSLDDDLVNLEVLNEVLYL